MSGSTAPAPFPLSRAEIDGWLSLKLMVVGDLMLDEYLWGRVDRISPEAPVQVVRLDAESSALGGAGNVIRNLASLGAGVLAAGAVGRDWAGNRLLEGLAAMGVDTSGIIRLENRPTSLKSRVMAGHQQVVRIDREDTTALTDDQAQVILDLATQNLDGLDGLILSDYAKGVLSPKLVQGLIRIFRRADKPVVVDPKGRDFSRYQGADLMTPNQKEAVEALSLDFSQMDRAEAAAREYARALDLAGLLITRGSEGMSLFPGQRQLPGLDPEPALHVPTQAREVYDVSGAGDTVAAVCGLGLASGWSMARSAKLANLAAGVVVAKLGTATLTPEELLEAARPRRDFKITPVDQVAAAVGRFKAAGKKVVFTNGCFDLFHSGHIHLLQASKAAGDVLVVGLDDDASVAGLKGPGRPILGQAERARILAALDCVDLVTVFETSCLENLLAELAPDVLTKGGNYSPAEVVGGRIVQQKGGRVELIPLEGEETTSSRVNRLLGNEE